MECNLTKMERFWLYRNHINIVALLLSISIIVKILEFVFNFDLYVLAPALSLIVYIIILRRLCIINKLYYVKLDFRKIYKLQKHKSKNKQRTYQLQKAFHGSG